MSERRDSGRRPAAFRVDEAELDLAPLPEEETAGLPAVAGIGEAVVPRPPSLPERRRFRWGRVFFSALGGLVALGLGLAVDNLVRDLFARGDWLGWLGLGLAAVAGLAAIVVLGRELAALIRLGRIDALRLDTALAAERDDAEAAVEAARALLALYAGRPDTARGRAKLAGHLREVIDGRDLLVLAEGDILAPLDRDARRLVAATAKRVSIVTAVSPRAVVDIVFVMVAVTGLIRRLAVLYGGRPGFLGLLRLARQAVAHLAVTGGMAAGDSLVSQLVGHGVAARLSAKLGEGVVNGLLTARIGLSAIDVCRPMPFLEQPRPSIPDVVGGLVTAGASDKAAR